MLNNGEIALANPNVDNLDPSEIAKFDALAERWWDLEGDFRPLHQINPLRLNWIESKILLVEKTALDVGCGGGILTEGMAQRGAQVTGIDKAGKALEVAKQHLNHTQFNNTQWQQQVAYASATAEQWSQTHSSQYDIVTCLEMLEHVPDPAATIAACSQMVKPGGDVFFSTINRNPKAFVFAIVGAEYILKLLPKGTHQYEYFIRPSELAHWARRSGLEEQDIIGLTYNPITKRYKLKSDVQVNYMMHFKKPL